MGIRFSCPNGHKLHVKEFLAGKRGVCPNCGAKFTIPPAQESPAPAASRAAAGSGESADERSASDFASQSMVISIVEPSRAPLARAPTTPPAISATSAASTADLPPAIVTLPSTAAAAAPAVAAEPVAPVAENVAPSVSRYAARRLRSRRNQTRLAVALLVAVIVLAALLIVVLRNQDVSPGEGDLARIVVFDAHHCAASTANRVTGAMVSAKAI